MKNLLLPFNESTGLISRQMQNKMIEIFIQNMAKEGIKPNSKKYKEYQLLFFQGVFSLLDEIKNDSTTAITPYIYYGLLRSDILRPQEDIKKD